MMLIYSQERAAQMTDEQLAELKAAHWRVMGDATAKGILLGAEPLGRTTTATTVRVEDGKTLITDGPFAETKEALAGYYILECQDLDEAIDWAARIPTGCKGGEGCIEIRPMPGLPRRPQATVEEHAGSRSV
ncbi:MAG TPA: YciI family protein [Bryobacteraceae bacterium]|nr:YciI family protein [Bryobacteraceae bacterium]